jgi:hypothetical protein
MTYEQTGTMLANLVAVYSDRLMPPITKNTIRIWSEHLADAENERVLEFINRWVKVKKYPPTIADIWEQIENERKMPARQNPKPPAVG